MQLIEASDREDLIARLSTSLAGGSPPDLFLMNYRFYGQFAARGALEPLEPYVEDSDEFELDDFYPQAVDAFRWNGEVTCLPQNISSLVVYFNRDLFRKYGVDAADATGCRGRSSSTRRQQMTRDESGQPVRGADPDLPPQPNTAPRRGLRPRRRADDHPARAVHLVERRRGRRRRGEADAVHVRHGRGARRC